MIPILLKSILCSGILLGIYHVFLSNEKLLKFNRWYLIFSIVFSYTIPWISNPWNQEVIDTQPVLIIGNPTLQTVKANISQNWILENVSNIILVIYLVVTVFLLLKAIILLTKISQIKGKRFVYDNATICLNNDIKGSFSFWNTIYLNQTNWENGKIDERIILHEKAHLQQKHSWDILFVELVKIISWFNPFVFAYKKAIINNHEFLADNFVLHKTPQIQSYQHLILNEIENNLQLTHSFNFNNTKKRFIMMTTAKTKWTYAKQFAIVPVITLLFMGFSQQTKAQEKQKTKPKSTTKTMVDGKKNSLSKQLIKNNTSVVKKKTEKTAETENIIKEEVLQKLDTVNVKMVVDYDLSDNFKEYSMEIRKKLSSNFNTSAIEPLEKGIFKANLSFVLDTKGNITFIKVDGTNESFNNEAKKSLLKLTENGSLQPITKNGIPINYRFSMPITIQFD
ncbi:MAG: M56 family metallopeptidase [Bacteroidetes bacterium]|nr:M56 family metallopeptidase [Bacteroidota bacterium]